MPVLQWVHIPESTYKITEEKGGGELMSKRVDFEQDEMMLMAIYAEKSREATIQTMQEAIEVLQDDPDVITAEQLIETIRSTIEKLLQIEDEYFYSLDLTSYLYEEDEADAY